MEYARLRGRREDALRGSALALRGQASEASLSISPGLLEPFLKERTEILPILMPFLEIWHLEITGVNSLNRLLPQPRSCSPWR